MQSAMMQILYKGIFRWFLKLIVGVQFPDTRFLRKEGQQPSGYTQPAFFPTRQPFVESKTRSRGRLLRKNPVSGRFQQLLHQHPSHQKKRRKGLGTRPTPENARCHR